MVKGDKEKAQDRKQRMNELELRIGQTASGRDFLQRVESIGKSTNYTPWREAFADYDEDDT